MVSRAVKNYMDTERERILDGLVQAAISLLHHDTTDGDDVDLYERKVLRERFTAVLAPPSRS